jgi:hypothetical protein
MSQGLLARWQAGNILYHGYLGAKASFKQRRGWGRKLISIYLPPGFGLICHMQLKGRQAKNRLRITTSQLSPMNTKPK